MRTDNWDIKIGQFAASLAEGQDTYLEQHIELVEKITDFSQGVTWWRPTVAVNNRAIAGSKGVDTFSVPGRAILRPRTVTLIEGGGSLKMTWKGAWRQNKFWFPGDTYTQVAPNYDLFSYDPVTNATALSPSESTNIVNTSWLTDAAYDPTNDKVYFASYLNTDFTAIVTTPGAGWAGNNWTQYGGYITAKPTLTLAVHRGQVLVYEGNRLFKLGTSPNFVLVFDDGLGPDASPVEAISGTTYPFPYVIHPAMMNLMTSAPTGAYTVKNIAEGESVRAHVSKVVYDGSTWTGTKLATLPRGNWARSIVEHMGSVLILTSTWAGANFSKGQGPSVTLWHITEGQLGVLASWQYPITQSGGAGPDPTKMTLPSPYPAPSHIAGTDRHLVYLGCSPSLSGTKDTLMVYDATNGGIHFAPHPAEVGVAGAIYRTPLSTYTDKTGIVITGPNGIFLENVATSNQVCDLELNPIDFGRSVPTNLVSIRIGLRFASQAGYAPNDSAATGTVQAFYNGTTPTSISASIPFSIPIATSVEIDLDVSDLTSPPSLHNILLRFNATKDLQIDFIEVTGRLRKTRVAVDLASIRSVENLSSNVAAKQFIDYLDETRLTHHSPSAIFDDRFHHYNPQEGNAWGFPVVITGVQIVRDSRYAGTAYIDMEEIGS